MPYAVIASGEIPSPDPGGMASHRVARVFVAPRVRWRAAENARRRIPVLRSEVRRGELKLAEQGMRPFTSNTVTEPAQLETELAGLGPGDPVTEFGQFRDKVCCAGVAVPGADPGSWWALGTSARGLNLPSSLLGELQFAAADLTR